MSGLKKWASLVLLTMVIAGLLGVGGWNLYQKLSTENIQMADVPFGVLPVKRLEQGRAFVLTPDIEKLEPFLKNLYIHSKTYWEEGRYTQAVTHLKELININKKTLPAYVTLAEWMQSELYFEKVSQSEIADLYRKALYIDKGHPLVRNNFGELLWKMGLKDSARVHFEIASNLSPTYPQAYVNLGRHLIFVENYREAQYNFQLAITLLKGEAPSPYDELAWVYYKQGKDDSAGLVIDHAKSVGVYNEKLQFVEALLWEVTDNIDVAKNLLMNLLEKDSSNVDYQWAYKTLGHKAPRAKLMQLLPSVDRTWEEATEAIEILDPLVKRYPDNAVLWYALGQAYLKRELNAHAVNAFDFAIAIDSTLEGLADYRDKALKRSELSIASSVELENLDSLSLLEAEENGTSEGGDASKVILGRYLIPWGSTQDDVKRVYSPVKFISNEHENLKETFVEDSLSITNHLGFKERKLYGILAKVVDLNRGQKDLFGYAIGLNTKISGNGKSTGTAACAEKKPFQGVIWENEDTIEFMIQYQDKTWEVLLLRVDKQYVKEEPKLCDYLEIMLSEQW